MDAERVTIMNIKPKAGIGDPVNILGCDCIQTSYNWRSCHLAAKHRGKFLQYYVNDVKIEISLKTGETKYYYLISRDKEMDVKWFHGGWVSGSSIELITIQEMAI